MEPQDTVSARREALTAYERGDADALAKLAHALRSQPSDGGLLIAEARARSAVGDPAALDRLEAMLRHSPDWLDGHVAYAQLRWEAGDRDRFLDAFQAALRQRPGHAGLWFRYMTAIAGSGDPGRAADVARRLRRNGGDSPALRLIEAHHAGMAGDLARAGALLAGVPDDHPDKAIEAARHRLRTGDPAGAARVLDEVRGPGGSDSGVWALTELAWRASGDPRHDSLIDVARHVGVIDLAMTKEEVATLAAVLRRLHHVGGRPLGQSVREGTQTRGNLWLRGEPEIAALRARLEAAVADFASGLPEPGPGHPLRPCREEALDLVTGWSIRLHAGGHHISHIHAHGVLSSACYIAVPADTQGQDGWLELGRPPADIALDLAPLAQVEPRPGRLVLFPSYLYHGTRPFLAGERLTIAFDAAPLC